VSDHWYFAYGSNLSTEQMESRTGRIREVRRARLDGYRIAFNKRGSDGTGKANIVPDPEGTVWGVVYRCSAAALSDMDRHEGVAGGHYARTGVRVRVDAGDELDSVAYVAGESFVDGSCVPSKEYLKTILHGAQHHALPDDYIRELERVAHGHD
jgi:gamma-glutamylcyclotransferase